MSLDRVLGSALSMHSVYAHVSFLARRARTRTWKTLVQLIALRLGASLLFLAFVSAAQANSVTNGSFETGDFTGWTLAGNSGFTGVDQGTIGFGPGAKTGSFAAYFGPVGSLGFLSQDVPTLAGATYNLTFFLANDGQIPNEFRVSWNGTVLLDAASLPASGYVQEAFPALLATAAFTPLQFGFRNDPGYFYLDDVYVGAGAVPEPATLLLWGTTMSALAFARWRRRQPPTT